MVTTKKAIKNGEYKNIRQKNGQSRRQESDKIEGNKKATKSPLKKLGTKKSTKNDTQWQ